MENAALCMVKKAHSVFFFAFDFFGEKHLVELSSAQSFLQRMEGNFFNEESTMIVIIVIIRLRMFMGSGLQDEAN